MKKNLIIIVALCLNALGAIAQDAKAKAILDAASEEFEKSVVSKNIYKDKITELHRLIHKQILDMGIPSDAFESAKFYSKMKESL
jgi:phosphoribosyl-dephospho-CoA transferase